jgi:hypothetical protein
MKKNFTCTLICIFGFYLPGKTQLHSECHTICTENGEHTLSIQQVQRLNIFKTNNRVKNSFTSYPVLINAGNSNTTANIMTGSGNVFRRWLTDGLIQTPGDMTIAFSSFTTNSVDNISILFLVPLKKFNL